MLRVKDVWVDQFNEFIGKCPIVIRVYILLLMREEFFQILVVAGINLQGVKLDEDTSEMCSVEQVK